MVAKKHSNKETTKRVYGVHILMCVCFLLPGCGFTTKNVKKSSPSSPDGDSIFAPISEESVRSDMRAHYNTDNDSSAKDDPSMSFLQLSRKEKKNFIKNRILEKEARLVDVPLLLGAEPLEEYFLDGEGSYAHSELGYDVDYSKKELEQFFLEGMEREGWTLSTYASGVESFLYFVKPNRFCLISIRPKKSRYILVIATGET